MEVARKLKFVELYNNAQEEMLSNVLNIFL